MTPTRATRMLTDLHQWAPLLTDTVAAILHPRANTYTPKGGAAAGRRDLGDLLAPTLDQPEDGPQGIRTRLGLEDWAAAWARTAGRTYPGPVALLGLADDAETLAEQWAEWETFTEELQQVHARLAHQLGYAPTPVGPCPNCSGTTHRQPTQRGLADPIDCDSCMSWWPDTDAYRQAVTDADVKLLARITAPGIYVTTRQALKIHPSLNRKTLQKWVERGHVTRRNGLNLAQINQKCGTVAI